MKNIEVKTGPIREILEIAFELLKIDTERPDVSALRDHLQNKYPTLSEISKADIKDILNSPETLVPNYISFNGNEVSLHSMLEIILKSLNSLKTYKTNQ